MPPVESEADRASFFDAAEFGQIAEIQGKEIEGYFDETTEFIDGIAPVSVQSTNPTFQCTSLQLPSDIAEGEPVSITRQDGTIFSGEVVTVEPDGFGLSLLTLQNNE